MALRVSASRVYVRWDPATDPSGVAGYLVALGGEPVLVSDVNDAFVAGLAPGATASVTVAAIDRGGNVSPPSTASVTTTGPEDRGP